MSLPRIVGITGYAQHGKDTIAAALVEEGYERHALADILKQAVRVLDPYVEEAAFGEPIRLSGYCYPFNWETAKELPEVRRLLQVFGTEVGRQLLGENVWIEALAKSIPNFYSDQGPKVVIPDVRFLNEAQWVRRCRGEVWKVSRVNEDGTPFANGVGFGHASEREIAVITEDERFINDTTVEGLKAQVRRYVEARNAYPGMGPTTSDLYTTGEFSEWASVYSDGMPEDNFA